MNWLQLLSSDRTGEKKKLKGDQLRSAFEQDFDRIIFSHPFRRLQDKTQVHPLPEEDFVHTRLTHSLEVSSVGRSLGKKVGETIIQRHTELKNNFSAFDFGAITAASSLAHDLGNPPFGHSGEDAISDFFVHHPIGKLFKGKMNERQWQDVTHFEGNAQGFRLLNKGENQGLKLTYATLAAFSKYPRESLLPSPHGKRKSQKKYGFFQSEKEIFRELAQTLGLISMHQGDHLSWCRHPLAFLVEAADDICYHIIDLEDGCRLGLVSPEETIELLSAILGDKFNPVKFNRIKSDNEKIGLLRAMSIGIVIDQCASVFVDHEQDILAGAFDQALTDLVPCQDILRGIINLSVKKIYRSRKVMETEAAGFEVLPGLLEEFTLACHNFYLNADNCSNRQKALVRLLPQELLAGMEEHEGSVYHIISHCIDLVASMTDSHAISLYRKIKGISLPK